MAEACALNFAAVAVWMAFVGIVDTRDPDSTRLADVAPEALRDGGTGVVRAALRRRGSLAPREMAPACGTWDL